MTDRSLESVARLVLSEASDAASEARKKIKNVARPEDPVDAPERTKQQEIQKKIIDEQEKTKMSDAKRFAELQGVSPSLIEAVKKVVSNKPEEEIKGGKTKVDVMPNTKDPDMKEALHPNQRKLDVAPPKGKLTAADFAKLRKEEVALGEATKIAPLTDKETTAVKNHLIKKYGKGKVSFNTEHGAHFVSHDDGFEENHHMISRDGGKLKVSHHMTVSNEETEIGEARGVAAGAVDKHNCATHVYHEQFGEGKPIYSQHADPDVNGNIAWYDVMFEHGIVRELSINEMKVLASESHERHGKKMKKEELELDEADVASAQKAAQNKLKSAQITAKATVQADKIKDQARKQAQMNSFEPTGNPLVEAIKKMIREPKYQVTSDNVKGVKSADAGQTHLSDEYVDEGRKPKEPEEKPRGDEHPFAPRKADAHGKVTFKHQGKEYTDSVNNFQKHRGHYMDAQGADRKDKVLHGYISSLGK
jgi:hypothetical protein